MLWKYPSSDINAEGKVLYLLPQYKHAKDPDTAVGKDKNKVMAEAIGIQVVEKEYGLLGGSDREYWE